MVAALSLLLVGPTATSAAGAPSLAPTKAKPVTTSYENPLAPQIPGDGTVDSCADPMILQGQDGETIDGEQVWYMYCTTDPLNDEDVDENGDPIFHRIPMNVSTDLVNWTEHPTALAPGKPGELDAANVFTGSVIEDPKGDGFHIFYTGWAPGHPEGLPDLFLD